MFPIVIPVGSGETLKYATGSEVIETGQQLLTITDLGFRPYAVYLQHSENPAGGFGMGICNAQGNVVKSIFLVSGMGFIDPATFTPNNDGFTFQITFYGEPTVAWYAVGK